MRLVKMFGLAAVMAVVGMAFMGVGSAMAEFGLDLETVICSQDVLLCGEEPGGLGGTILPKDAIITAKSLAPPNDPVLLGAINQLCEESTIKVKITSEGGMGDPLEGEDAGLSFAKCKPCTTVTAKAGKGTIQMSGEVEGAPHWIIKTSGETVFKGCPFGVECKFSGPVELLALNDLALGGLLVLAEEELLPLTGGNSKFFCGEHGFWDAHYVAEGHWLSSHELPL